MAGFLTELVASLGQFRISLLLLSAAVSGVESSSVVITFFLFLLLFTALLVAELTILLKAIRKGPESIIESK